MRNWLPRFCFSFLLLGGFFFYQLYRDYNAHSPEKTALLAIGSILFVVLGVMGLRLRHLPPHDR